MGKELYATVPVSINYASCPDRICFFSSEQAAVDLAVSSLSDADSTEHERAIQVLHLNIIDQTSRLLFTASVKQTKDDQNEVTLWSELGNDVFTRTMVFPPRTGSKEGKTEGDFGDCLWLLEHRSSSSACVLEVFIDEEGRNRTFTDGLPIRRIPNQENLDINCCCLRRVYEEERAYEGNRCTGLKETLAPFTDRCAKFYRPVALHRYRLHRTQRSRHKYEYEYKYECTEEIATAEGGDFREPSEQELCMFVAEVERFARCRVEQQEIQAREQVEKNARAKKERKEERKRKVFSVFDVLCCGCAATSPYSGALSPSNALMLGMMS